MQVLGPIFLFFCFSLKISEGGIMMTLFCLFAWTNEIIMGGQREWWEIPAAMLQQMEWFIFAKKAKKSCHNKVQKEPQNPNPKFISYQKSENESIFLPHLFCFRVGSEDTPKLKLVLLPLPCVQFPIFF